MYLLLKGNVETFKNYVRDQATINSFIYFFSLYLNEDKGKISKNILKDLKVSEKFICFRILNGTSNKRLRRKPPSILERDITDNRLEKTVFLKNENSTGCPVNECQTFPCRETVNITITANVRLRR